MTPLDLTGLSGVANNTLQNVQNMQTNIKNVSPNQSAQNINQQQNQNMQDQNTQNNQNTEDLEKQTQKAIQQLMENLSYLNTHLNITIDKKADTTVIKIIDNKTNQVLKEIPPEYMLKIAEAINNLVGIFVNKKV